jgi:hypothetical protein
MLDYIREVTNKSLEKYYTPKNVMGDLDNLLVIAPIVTTKTTDNSRCSCCWIYPFLVGMFVGYQTNTFWQ